MAGIFLPGTSKGGDISGVTAGVGLSGGGDSGGVTLTLDLSELSAVVPTSGDWFGTLDSDDTNEQLTTTDALATLFAGTGLTAASAVIGVDAAQTQITSVGTIATGTWEATDVGVTHGGTGASTLTANGVLIGNGTSAISSVAMATKGHILIGDGSGNPQMLGVGSNDQVLVADSGETTGVKWAAASAGAVTALNNATANEIVTVGSTTTELDAESTLTFASSKLIPTATAHGAAGTALTMSAGPTTAGTTNNIAGGALTFQGGQGKGSGAGGSIVFQTANAAGSGSSLNALATALTIEDDLNATFGNDVLLNTDSAVLKMGADADATLTHDGTTGLTVAANPFEVDSGGNITLDAHTGIFIFQDANTEVLRITEGNSGDVTIKLETNAKDLIFTDNGDATGLTIKDAAAGIVVPGEVMTTKISFTDGDDAITIADSGITTIAKTMTFATDANVVLGDGGNVNISTPLLANADHTTTQEVIVADASAYATARAIGIAPAAISDTATGTVLLQGFIRDDTWNWTTGATLYLSETAGAMTETAPTTDGAFDVVVGVALEPDVVYFNPSMDVIEHA